MLADVKQRALEKGEVHGLVWATESPVQLGNEPASVAGRASTTASPIGESLPLGLWSFRPAGCHQTRKARPVAVPLENQNQNAPVTASKTCLRCI
jgi:hypothetical protein